jgi:hypothetical protein
MSAVLSPWVPTTLAPSAKKTSLVDDIAEVFASLWDKNEADFKALATSTYPDDAVEGTVTIDKILLARLIKEASGDNTRVGRAKVGDIAKVMHYAAKRYGVDRKSIASRKAEFLAIEQAAPAAEDAVEAPAAE